MITKQNIKTEKKVLRINLDGVWTSSEFSNLFESLTFLYQLVFEIESIELQESQYYAQIPKSDISKSILNINGELYKKMNLPLSYENEKSFEELIFTPVSYLRIGQINRDFIEDLAIKEIKYASPGFTDFVGLGKIIEQVFNLIKHYIPNENQKNDNLKQKLENRILEEELISKKLQHLQLIGYSKKEIRKYYDTRNNVILNLKQLELEDKITGFEIQDLN